MRGAHFTTGDAYSGPAVPGARRRELMGRSVGVFGHLGLEIQVDDGWAAFALCAARSSATLLSPILR
jgi:hypothetical protein